MTDPTETPPPTEQSGSEPSGIDLEELRAAITLPDEAARVEAANRLDRLTKPIGALGRLELLGVWLCGVQAQCPPRPLDRVSLVLIAGDHGVTQAGVSAYPPEVTAQMVANFVRGGAAVNALARLHGVTVHVHDLAVDADWEALGIDLPEPVTATRVRRGSGDISREPALTREEAERAFRTGMELADAEVDAGCDLLIVGDMGIGNTTAAAALTVVLTAADVASAVGRGTGIDDATWMRKAAAVRDAARRARPLRGDMIDVLAACGGADLAATAGLLVQAAVRRTPVLLDGVVSAAAALVAQRIATRSTRWFVAGHRSPEPAQHFALERLSLEPLLDLGMRLGEGTGALVALPVLRAAQVTLAEMSTFEEAGVTDKD